MPYLNLEAQREYQKNWRSNRRNEYVEKRGGKCERCPKTSGLEFHHRDRHAKLEHRIWTWSRPRIEKELAKCDLLCEGCHWKETVKERGYYTRPHGTVTSYQNYKCRCTLCRAANAAAEHARRLKKRSMKS